MKKVWKFVILAVLVAVVCSALPALAASTELPVNLGQDHIKMQWYIWNFGTKSDGTPFAVVRKYYTNDKVKQETIDLMMSKFGIAPEAAGSLYFTEYEYEYTKDGKQFAVSYLRHYNMVGEELHGTVYDGSSDATQKTFAAVDPKHASGRARSLAMKK